MDSSSTNPGCSVRSPLRAGRALLHAEGACLPLRSLYGECRACSDACPVSALTVTIEAVALSDACVGCGRCTAACPTQALALPEVSALDTLAAPAAGDTVVRIECRKVPTDALAPGSLVLPCVGALTPGHLLARAAAGVDVQVIDHGWCEGCDTGCTSRLPEHPALRAVEVAGMWLEATGAPTRPRVVREPLPAGRQAVRMAAPATKDPTISRRQFFREVLERPAGRSRATGTPMGSNGRAAYPAQSRQPSPERVRQHAALQRLAAILGTQVPAEFYPRLDAGASCCDRRMCVALCPTAALTAAESGATARLEWSSERCIACGTCVRACPEASLSLNPHGGRAGVFTLAEHARAQCRSCGGAFTRPNGRTDAPAPELCPSCAKSRQFMNDARRQLFGTRD